MPELSASTDRTVTSESLDSANFSVSNRSKIAALLAGVMLTFQTPANADQLPAEAVLDSLNNSEPVPTMVEAAPTVAPIDSSLITGVRADSVSVEPDSQQVFATSPVIDPEIPDKPQSSEKSSGWLDKLRGVASGVADWAKEN